MTLEARAFDEWKIRTGQCVNANGEYIEGDK